MRSAPTWRIPAGVLALMAALFLYGMLIATFLAPLINSWPGLAQLPVYALLGVLWLWLVPIRSFLKWMETGRWR